MIQRLSRLGRPVAGLALAAALAAAWSSPAASVPLAASGSAATRLLATLGQPAFDSPDPAG